MKIDHGSRQAYMSEPLLHIQKALPILQHVTGSAVPENIQMFVYFQLSKPLQYPNLSRFIL
jgi:hypothetical protein